MKLFVTLAGLLAAAQADPWGYGYGLHQQNWPSVRAPGFSATCFGCRGKRSAEADAWGYGGYGLGYAYGRGIGGHYGGGVSYSNRSPQGLGKRSADAWGYGLGRGIAAHPTGISYSNRSPQGLGASRWGKRDADAEADAWGYGGYGLGYAYGRGIGGHYGGGVSYSNRSPQGLGKRSADAWGYGLGRGIAAHPTGISYSNRSPQGLGASRWGKRSADADAWGYGYAPLGYGYGLNAGVNAHPTGISYSSVRLGKRDADAYGYAPVLAKSYPSWPGVVAPGFESTCYGCGLRGKRSADAFSYTQRSPQGLGARGYGWGRGYYWG